MDKVNISFWEFINSSIVGGVGAVIIKAYDSYKKKKKKTDPQANLLKIAQIYELMQEIIKDTLIDRCLIYKVSDGDKFVMPGVPIHMTILYESTHPKVEECKLEYQNFLLDEALTLTFKDASLNGSAIANMDIISPGSLLYAMMNNKKARHIQLYSIGKGSGMLWFAEVSSTTYPYELMNDDDQSKVLLYINKLKVIFEDSGKYL